jgi:biopolymer transport protein ExbD
MSRAVVVGVALVCVVLIYVVVIFSSPPLIAPQVITVLLPTPDPNPTLDCDRGPIFVKVGPDRAIAVNTIAVNEKTMEGSDLRRRLEEILQTRAERMIVFEADPRLQFKDVVSVLELCRSIPNLKIALVTSSIQNSQCFLLPIRRSK